MSTMNDDMSSVSSHEGPVKKRKVMFRVAAKDDIALLREVIAKFPFGAEHVREAFVHYLRPSHADAQAIAPSREILVKRTTSLLGYWRKQELESLRKSGCNDDYEEKEQLLCDLAELIDNLEPSQNSEKAARMERLENEGEKIRNAAIMSKVSETDEGSDANHGKKKTSQAVQLFESQFKNENEHRQEKLELMKQELEIRKQEADNTTRSIQMMQEIQSKQLELMKLMMDKLIHGTK
ncbi:hypothetical protein AC1031_000380 [Aphanomyces cochlioides]|nr:hypothetical protein AC1031_000377 [Aphanomyces cochlioides]KAG9415990.1 hypothetical protein AC1031_000380 [Aphanomyces cochlioides]